MKKILLIAGTTALLMNAAALAQDATATTTPESRGAKIKSSIKKHEKPADDFPGLTTATTPSQPPSAKRTAAAKAQAEKDASASPDAPPSQPVAGEAGKFKKPTRKHKSPAEPKTDAPS